MALLTATARVLILKTLFSGIQGMQFVDADKLQGEITVSSPLSPESKDGGNKASRAWAACSPPEE